MTGPRCAGWAAVFSAPGAATGIRHVASTAGDPDIGMAGDPENRRLSWMIFKSERLIPVGSGSIL
jgi:hypothetical protein